MIMSTYKILKFLNQLPASAFFLFIVFIIGFIATPYWQIPVSRVEKISLLGITLLGGTIWALISSGQCRVPIQKMDVLLFLSIVLAAGLLNYLTIQSDIPWRGDEDVHIGRTLLPLRNIKPEVILFFSGVFLLIGLISKKKPTISLILTIIMILLIVYLHIQYKPLIKPDQRFLFRYPFLNYWLYMVIPTFFSIIGKEYLEFLYRIIPLLSSAGIAFLFAKKIQGISKIPFISLWVFAILSMPLIYYYSSIYYLEPLALFLMCIVAVDMERLVTANLSEIKAIPAWYALLIIGFIKETTVIFIIIFFVIRLFYQLKPILFTGILKKENEKLLQPSIKKNIQNELSIAFSIFFPLALYLFYRISIGGIGRQFAFNIVNLFRLDTYQVFLRAVIDQFGFFTILWVAGILLFFYQKKIIQAAFTLILGCAVPLFYALDQWIYIGYSRFNLFMVPAILLAASSVIQWLILKKNIFVYLVLVITITTNIIISPINMDGTKKPFWGNYNYDTSEHYYPFDAAFRYLREKPVNSIFITGMTYPYYFKFYLSKYNLETKIKEKVASSNEVMDLEDAVAYAVKNEYDAVIYPILKEFGQLDYDHKMEMEKETLGYSTDMFCNQAHCLLVLTLDDLK